MATVDTSIYRMAQPQQTDWAAPLRMIAAGQGIADARQRNRLLEATQAQRDATNQAFSQAYNADTGQIDQNRLYGLLAQSGQGAAIPGVQQSFAAADRTAQQARLGDLQERKLQLDLTAQLLGGVTDPQTWAAARQQATQYGLPLDGVPEQYDPAYVSRMQQMTGQAQQQLDNYFKQQGLDIQRDRLNLERDRPKGQVTTLGDGSIGVVDPVTASFTPSMGPDGKPVRGKVSGQLSGAQLKNAQGKLQTVAILRKQLDNLKKAREGLGNFSQGLLAGHLPTEPGSNYDAALAALQTTVRQLTRTPGEGAMSDYESRLASAQLPSRADYGSSMDQKINQLEDLANVLEQGYTGLVGEQRPDAQTGGGQGAEMRGPSVQQRTVSRTGRTADGRRVVQYSDGSIEYAE